MLKRVLDLFRDPDPADVWSPPAPAPFGLVEDAVPPLRALAESRRVLRIVTEPSPERGGEHRIALAVVEQGSDDLTIVGRRDGPEADAETAPLPVRISDEDRASLAGLVLDHDPAAAPEAGWRLLLDLQVRARETPNRDARLYLVSRVLADGPPVAFSRRTQNPALPARLLEHPEIEAVLLRGGTMTVERTPGSEWSAIDALVDNELRAHLLAAGTPWTGGQVQYGTALENEVAELLEELVLPAVRRDGGEIRLLGVDGDGVARVRLAGACRSCPSSTRTLTDGVEATLLRSFPGRVRAVVREG